MWTFAAGAVLTTFLFCRIYSLETDKHNSDFARSAELRARLFDQSIRDSVAGLRSVTQLFAISATPIGAEQFREMTLPLLAQYSYIHSFAFHRKVDPAQRPAYEAAMRKVHPDFMIKQVSEGRLVAASGPGPWLVVEYYEPLYGNDEVLGFDALSDTVQGIALQRAMDTGMVSASTLKPASVRPRHRGVAGKVFALVLPVYRRGAPLNDAVARRHALIGETMAGFHANQFARQIFERAGLLNNVSIHISVYAAAANHGAALVFRHGAMPPPEQRIGPAVSRILGPAALTRVNRTFDMAGTPWHLVVSRDSPSAFAAHTNSLIVLGAGVALTWLVAAYLSASAARSRVIEQTVEKRTAQLSAKTKELQRTTSALQRTTLDLELRNRAIEASANAIFITSAEGPDYVVEYVNPAFQRMTGYAPEEIIGKSLRTLARSEEGQRGLIELWAAMAARKHVHATVRSHRKDGTMYWRELYAAPVRDENGQVHHFVHANYDVTETRSYQEQLEYRANFDALTGLANRNLLQDRLQQAILYAARFSRRVWVAYIDLDRFKFVNDSGGRKCGDIVLTVIAERLKAEVGVSDTVGRMGGDEFVLVMPQFESTTMMVDTIERILREVAKPVAVDEKEYFVSCSIGIAVYPNDGITGDSLLTHADVAMYRAKEMGRNNFLFFAPAMNTQTHARLQMEGALRKALDRNEFVLHYQPKVDIKSGRMVGVEALIRWNHPELGLVMPAQFIALTEETGLIIPIGTWVLRTACAQNRAWQAAGLHRLKMAVNLSGIQFNQPDVVRTVSEVLHESGLDPATLEIELTESIVMNDVERATATLHQLKAQGVRLSVDDFGTGYSSLAYLKRFPIDVVKIDQSFVRELASSNADRMIVVSIITLAHNLGLQVVAEGVETDEQLACLQLHDCDEVQGHYFSRAVEAENIGQMLADQTRADIDGRAI